MKYVLILPVLLLVGFCIDDVHALEFKPLIAKNTDNVEVSTGIVGKPIIFESVIANNEEHPLSFDVTFSTQSIRDVILDFQSQSVNLDSGETTTLTYQFVPSTEGNYVSNINFLNSFLTDAITFPALDDSKDYQKKTVMIYSNSTDEDCHVACTDPSVMNIDVGTVVEWNNTTPDKRYISTGSYMEDKDGANWSSNDRFHSIIIPERKSSFLFSQYGEYQLFLAEHRSSDVIGTVHVMSDQFKEADKTFNILNKIMNDKDFGIPISSLYINPKNSVITVGIDNKHNSLFTLDVYKTMLYKHVGNVYMNIVSDHDSAREKLCDVNNEVMVRTMLDKDPVVKQFLQNYPSATFEHFKTYDEPGNPRTYSEFYHGMFLLRVLVLTYDQQGVCYPVYGYTISYDDQTSEIKKELFENFFRKSDGISNPINEIKNLSKPSKQIKSGISVYDVQCIDGFTLLLTPKDSRPVCVTEDTAKKLILRHWGVLVSSMVEK